MLGWREEEQRSTGQGDSGGLEEVEWWKEKKSVGNERGECDTLFIILQNNQVWILECRQSSLNVSGFWEHWARTG